MNKMSSTPPQFFIVTPSYNQGHFLNQTLTSVNSQPELTQHIVMDGGSQDTTVKILKSFSSPKLKWFSQKDNGQTDAINKGLSAVLSQKNLATTIFAYLNSDDYYLPHAFRHVAQTFTEHPEAMWVVGDAEIVDEHNTSIQTWVRWYKKQLRYWLSFNLLLVLNPIPQPAVFIRLQAIKKIGLFDDRLTYTMDYEYWLRLWQTYGPPIFLDQPLAAFRIHTQSKGGSQFHRQFAEQFVVAKRFTSNPLILGLQLLHNQFIQSIYSWIK